MSHAALTIGALARICQGEDVYEPVLQLVGLRPLCGTGKDGVVKYRLSLNDGEYYHDGGILATCFNSLVDQNTISRYTVIKVKKYVSYLVGDGLSMIILEDVEVVQMVVGKMIGHPVILGKDGKVPQGELFFPKNQTQRP